METRSQVKLERDLKLLMAMLDTVQDSGPFIRSLERSRPAAAFPKPASRLASPPLKSPLHRIF